MPKTIWQGSLPSHNSGNVQKFHDLLVGRSPDKRILHHCSVWYLVNFQLGAALYLLVLGTGYLVLLYTWCLVLASERERKVDTDVVVVQESGGGQNQQESGGACYQSDHRHFPGCAMIPR